MENRRGFVKIVLLTIVLAAAAAGYYYYTHRAPADVSVGAMLNSMHDNATTTGGQPAGQYAWVFTDLGDAGIPMTHVSLIAGSAEHDIGDYEGTCSKQNKDFLPDEIEKVLCWYAGGGHEIGIFASSTTIVMVGEVNEGSAEVKEFRGNFETALTL